MSFLQNFYGKGSARLSSPALGMGKSLFGSSAADKAMPYLEQVGPMAQGYLTPYATRGREAYDVFNPVAEQMTQDPTGYINELMRGYTPSEGYKFKQAQMSKALGNTAAAGGFRGTENDQMQQAELIRGLLGQDMYDYLNAVQGAQGRGMSTLGGLYNTGYGASSGLVDALTGQYGSQASLAYMGQQQKNKQRAELIRALLQLAGGAMGGPGGAQAGGALGGAIGGGV